MILTVTWLTATRNDSTKVNWKFTMIIYYASNTLFQVQADSILYILQVMPG